MWKILEKSKWRCFEILHRKNFPSSDGFPQRSIIGFECIGLWESLPASSFDNWHNCVDKAPRLSCWWIGGRQCYLQLCPAWNYSLWKRRRHLIRVQFHSIDREFRPRSSWMSGWVIFSTLPPWSCPAIIVNQPYIVIWFNNAFGGASSLTKPWNPENGHFWQKCPSRVQTGA